MPRPDYDYFSPGFRNFLELIKPYGRKEVLFPSGVAEARIGKQEHVHPWFRRLVDSALDSHVERCAVEENMGVFARLQYRDKGEIITHVNLQVLVTETDLETYYLNPDTRARYFRLDYDPDRLGPIFKEPLPHVHSRPVGAPRFSMWAPTGNVVVDFFDFIYRNFYHENWLGWAKHAYSRWQRSTGTDIFVPIEEAFKTKDGHTVLVSEYEKQLRDIKSACRTLKDRIFTARINAHSSKLLTYDSL